MILSALEYSHSNSPDALDELTGFLGDEADAVGLELEPTPGACFMVLVAFSGAWPVEVVADDEEAEACAWPASVVCWLSRVN